MKQLELRPCDFATARDFVRLNHRHNKPPAGHKYSIACYDRDRLCGVCTMLYGAACRAAKALGYRRIITYTRESEPGTSLKASNWLCDGRAGGTHWTGGRYEQVEMQLGEMKVRWRKEL